MSRKKRSNEASSARDRVRQAAAQLKPVAARVKPLASSTGAAARHRVRRTRAWAAPQVERTGHVLQDRVAPKVSALLSSAAHRIEPAEPRKRRWRKPITAATFTAAASAAAAYVRNRMKPDATTSADAGDVASAAKAPDGHATTANGAGADADRQVRTS